MLFILIPFAELGGSINQEESYCGCFCCAADAGNQLVAQEAVRKPSILRRPSARAGDPPSSTNRDHVSLSGFASKAQRYA